MAKITTYIMPSKAVVVSEAWPSKAGGAGRVGGGWPASTHKGWGGGKGGGAGMPRNATGVPGQPHLKQASIGGGKTGIFHASTGAHIGTIHHGSTGTATHTVSHVTGGSVKGSKVGFVAKSAGFGKMPKIK